MPSLSWCCKSLHEISIDHCLLPFATSLLVLAHSLSPQAPLPLFLCCLRLCFHSCHRQRVQIFCLFHSESTTKYPWFLITKFWGDGIQEFLKVNFSTFSFQFSDHCEDGWVLWFKPETLHSRFELSRWDEVYLGSIFPVASVSKRLKAYLSSSI